MPKGDLVSIVGKANGLDLSFGKALPLESGFGAR